MTVDSYLELFTTLFGWTFYGILWDVLVGTGIVFLVPWHPDRQLAGTGARW